MDKVTDGKVIFKNAKYYLIALISFSVIVSCNTNTQKENTPVKINNLYLSYAGEREGFKIWIVNGNEVREKYIDEFVYGGNPQRYPFIPEKEIWIDNSISAEEFETTVAHEIREQNLMSMDGLLYVDAHDSAFALEVKMRKKWEELSREHESILDSVTPRDFDTTMEIVTLPEKIKLKNIYRIPLGEKGGMKIWIVDGYAVRRDIFPDFSYSGNDKEYFFIPEGEIWIDGQISCEETEYSIALELNERKLMKEGTGYDDAYSKSLLPVRDLREENKKRIEKQPEVKKTDPAFRDKGTGSVTK